MRQVLEKTEKKYCLKLPRTVIAIDYGEDIGDLFIRFRNAESTEGEPTDDGRVIIHYDKKGKIAALEIMDLTAL